MYQEFTHLRKAQLEKNRKGWMKSFLEGFSQDENGNAVPWMTYPAIEFLQENLRKTDEVFEFGAGASTIFFSQRVKKVVTLETNKKWYEIITQMLADLDIKNVELILMSDGLKNSAYENFAKNRAEKFDFIVVDSLKRFECATISTAALKQGGTMLLDDSERKNYQKIFKFFAEKNFQQTDFFGVAPAQLRIKNTTVFTAP
jgi:predicted O-methyltransferase YrrM